LNDSQSAISNQTPEVRGQRGRWPKASSLIGKETNEHRTSNVQHRTSNNVLCLLETSLSDLSGRSRRRPVGP